MSNRTNRTLRVCETVSGGAVVLLAIVLPLVIGGCKAQPADMNESSKVVFPGRGADAKAFGYTRDGNWAMSQGRFVDALDAYLLALTYQPEDADAHYGAGQCQLALGSPAEAIMHLKIAYDEAWARRTESFEKAGYLAEAMQRAGQCNDAMMLLEQRAMAGGAMPDYLRWAEYAAKCNDPDMAERVYLMAIRLDDGDTAEAYYQFGQFYEQIGNIEQAMKRWRQAYGLNPNDPDVIDSLSRYVQVVGPTLKLPPDRVDADM